MLALNLLILLLSFIAMELVAWLTHKYVMHGFLWKLHHDHHRKDHDNVMERNDFFFLIFATPGILLIYFGMKSSTFDPLLWIGLGISLYGLAYVLMHDIFIHQRIKILTRTDNFYLRAVRKAHKMHHKHLERENGECFGMLWAPPKYVIEAKRSTGRK